MTMARRLPASGQSGRFCSSVALQSMEVDRSSRSTGSFLRLADTAGPISLRGVRFGPPVSCRSAGAAAGVASVSGRPAGALLPPTSGGNSVITYPSNKPADALSSPGTALENTYQTLSTGVAATAAMIRADGQGFAAGLTGRVAL